MRLRSMDHVKMEPTQRKFNFRTTETEKSKAERSTIKKSTEEPRTFGQLLPSSLYLDSPRPDTRPP